MSARTMGESCTVTPWVPSGPNRWVTPPAGARSGGVGGSSPARSNCQSSTPLCHWAPARVGGPALEQHHRQTPTGQLVGGVRSGGAGTDDDRVDALLVSAGAVAAAQLPKSQPSPFA